MKIGSKIKRIRNILHLTQSELGIKCGFPSNSADVRIAQYEKGNKIPREKVLKQLSDALDIDETALYITDVENFETMTHVLFDMEEYHGLKPVKIDGNLYLSFQNNDPGYRSLLESWYNLNKSENYYIEKQQFFNNDKNYQRCMIKEQIKTLQKQQSSTQKQIEQLQEKLINEEISK